MSDTIIIGLMPKDWKPAEIVPHPAWTRRIADDVLRQLYSESSPSWRRKLLKDAVTKHRRRLEQLGVAEHHVERDVAALQGLLFGNNKTRRVA